MNCAYCHKAGGTALGNWDGRPELTLAQTGLVNGSASNNGGNALNKLVVPGDPAHSIVLNRIAVTNGFTRMPPLGSNIVDSANVSLLTSWINGELDDRVSYEEWAMAEFGDPQHPGGLDSDLDGVSDYDEFLAGTSPHSGASAPRPQVTTTGDGVKLSFDLPVNRSFLIESSGNLQTWTPWDIPGNQSLPVKGGLTEIIGPIDQPLKFFRVMVREN